MKKSFTVKSFSVLTALVLVACLVSCTNNENITQDEKNDSIRFWTDEETGVEYVIYSHSSNGYTGMGGITPRLNADGTLYHPTEKGGVRE